MEAWLSLGELARSMRIELAEDSPMRLWRFRTRCLTAGETPVRQGDRLRNLYVVHSGFFRTFDNHGASERVTGFPMSGDTLGADAIGEGVHPSGSVALETAQVAIVPYARIEQMECKRGLPGSVLVNLLCRENARKSELISLLAYRNATARVAAFLLYLGERFERLGYSRYSYILPMRCADIGNFLGLRAETLSRAFASLNAAGFADIHLKSVDIRKPDLLRAFAEGDQPECFAKQRGLRRARVQPAISCPEPAWTPA